MNSEPTPDELSTRDLPPHSLEAEQGILGCCLLDPSECLIECAEKIATPEVFYDLRHRGLYESLQEMAKAGQRIDMITVCQFLKDRQRLEAFGGMAYVASLSSATPSAANLSFYIEIAQEQATRRRIIASAARASVAAKEGGDLETTLAAYETEVMAIRDRRTSKAIHGRELAEDLIRDIEEHLQRGGKLAGITYGIPFLDHLTGGMHRGELVVVGARPSIGKTAFGGSIAIATALVNPPDAVPTLFLTIETNARAIVRRLACGVAQVPLGMYRAGSFVEGDQKRLTAAAVRLKNSPLWVEQHLNGITAAKVRAVIRHHARKNGVQVVIVDYLQKIRPDRATEKRTYDVAQVSEALKAEAEASNVAVVALAQLSRDAEDQRPTLKDLADSGQIERDADVVILIHREREEKEGPAVLYVEKQRDGELGAVKTHYIGRFCRFYPPQREPPANSEREK